VRAIDCLGGPHLESNLSAVGGFGLICHLPETLLDVFGLALEKVHERAGLIRVEVDASVKVHGFLELCNLESVGVHGVCPFGWGGAYIFSVRHITHNVNYIPKLFFDPITRPLVN
jgi:hypothetical protein